MKWWVILLLIIFAVLQVRLWSDNHGIAELRQLEKKVAEQKQANASLQERNRSLRKQVEALRQSDAAIERNARLHLGMIKQGETFYRFIPKRAQ